VRLTILLGAASMLLLAAAPAQARLVYVKDAGSERPRVYVAEDDGTKPRRIGTGRSPTVSADGRWVAWIAPGTVERVLLRRADRSRKARRVADSSSVTHLAFSPDSTRLGMAVTGRLSVHDIRARTTLNAATGNIRGFSFSPDSKSVVYGTAGRNDAVDAESDLHAVELDSGPRWRITRDRKSLNPLWGPAGIVHDRQKARAGDTPSYNLFDIKPDGGSLRRITALRIPSRLSGLVPIELSVDGRRLLAQFVGENTGVGFAVNPSTGKTRSLGRDVERGFLGFDLSADGRTVLGHTGGPDPTTRHDVVTVPWGGGEPTVLVRRAAFPDWSL
jgi:hypothetical protein